MTVINDELVIRAVNEYGRLYSLPQNPFAVTDLDDAMGTIEDKLGLTVNEARTVFKRAVDLGLVEDVDGVIQLKKPRY